MAEAFRRIMALLTLCIWWMGVGCDAICCMESRALSLSSEFGTARLCEDLETIILIKFILTLALTG